jgi:hypothetical protein
MVTKKPRKKRTVKEKPQIIPIRFEKTKTGIPVFWLGDDRISFCQTDKTNKGYKSIIVNACGTDLIKQKDKKTRIPVKVRESNHIGIDFSGLPSYIGNDDIHFKHTLETIKKVVRKHVKDGILPFEKIEKVVRELCNG